MARSTRATKQADATDTTSESSPRTRRRVSRRSSARQNGRKQQNPATKSDEQSDQDGSGAYVQESEDDDDVESLNSETLDDPDFDASGRKRKRTAGSKNSSPKKSRFLSKSPKRSPSIKKRADDEEKFEDGVEVVGTVVQAPKTGHGMSQLGFSYSFPNAKFHFSATWPNITEHSKLFEAATESRMQ